MAWFESTSTTFVISVVLSFGLSLCEMGERELPDCEGAAPPGTGRMPTGGG